MKKREKKSNIIIKSFKFRAYPNKGTARRTKKMMCDYANIWNRGLMERQESYEESKKDETKKAVNSFYSQYHLIRKREHPELKNYDAQSMQDVLVKLDGSYKSFFKLIKKYPEARPPKERRFFHNVTYRQSGWRLEGNILLLNHLGKFRLRLHRQIEGRIKTVSIAYENRKFYACFSCEIPKIQGACSPMPAYKPCFLQGLRQEYIPPGGSDPERSGTYNLHGPLYEKAVGGSDPERSGTYNLSFGQAQPSLGGSDPERSGTYNFRLLVRATPKGPVLTTNQQGYIQIVPTLPNCCRQGGSDPERSGTYQSGSDPEKSDTYNLYKDKNYNACGGSDPEKSGTTNERIEIEFVDGFFLRDSQDRYIMQPEFYANDIGTLRRLSRALSRKKKGSRNRAKARHTLAKWHEHIKNKRHYFLWQIAGYYAANYKEVTIPKLPLKYKIQYALTSKYAQKLCDGSYGIFVQMLKHKCNEYGTSLIERKDTLWEKEIENLTEAKRLENLQQLLRKARRIIRWQSPAALPCLKRDLERAVTLLI